MTRKTTPKATTDSPAEETIAEYRDAFEALFEPGEAAVLRMRAEALLDLRAVLQAWSGTQAQKATRLGITQPRFALLMTGNFNAVSLDFVIKMAARAGMEAHVNFTKPRSEPHPQGKPKSAKAKSIVRQLAGART